MTRRKFLSLIAARGVAGAATVNPIAFDNATVATPSATGASSLNYTHVTGASLANSKIIIGVVYYSTAVSVSTLSYNSVNATLIQRINNGVAQASCELWWLDAPSSGSHTVSITLSGALPGNSVLNSAAYTFSGMKSGADETHNGRVMTGTHSSQADSVTTVHPNAWIIDVLAENAGTTAPVAMGSQAHVLTATTATTGSIGMSTLGPVNPPALTSVGFTFTSNANASAHLVASFAPAATPRNTFIAVQ